MVIYGEFCLFILLGLTYNLLSSFDPVLCEARAADSIAFEIYSVSQPATGQFEGTAVNLHFSEETGTDSC